MSVAIKNVIEALSGKDSYKKPKAFYSLIHTVEGTDGSRTEKESLFIEKPIIKIYRSLSHTTVDFIFEFPKDKDLLRHWEFLNRYHSPENSVYYSMEDIEAAANEDGTFKETLYSHALVLSIASKEPKGKFYFENLGDIIYYALVPERPGEADTIIRMVFDTSETALVEVDDASLADLQKTAMREAEVEVRNEV